MPIKANNFVWVDKAETPNNIVEGVLLNIKDTDESKAPTDARLLPEKEANNDILLDKEGTLRLERSQYTEDMVGDKAAELINKKKI